MNRLVKFFLAMYQAWKQQHDAKVAEEVKLKDEATKAIDKIEEDIQVDVSAEKKIAKCAKDLTKRGKDLGLILLLAILLPVASMAQVQEVPPVVTAEQRIQTYSHEDLQTYARELVTLAEDQRKLINDMEKAQQETAEKLRNAQLELVKVSRTLDKLGTPTKHGLTVQVLQWVLKAAPAVLAGVAAIK